MKITKSTSTGEVFIINDGESVALSRADWNQLRRDIQNGDMGFSHLPEWNENDHHIDIDNNES